MAAPDITKATHYINVGTTVVLWVPSISDYNAPTRSELDAGTNLARENSASDGWKTTSEFVDTPNMKTKFTPKIPGRRTADDSSLTMYRSLDGVDATDLMPVDEPGFIVWMDAGDVAGRDMDIFPVTVASHGKERSVEGTDATTVEIQYAITDEPAEKVAIPS
jgi:hypothetical protein